MHPENVVVDKMLYEVDSALPRADVPRDSFSDPPRRLRPPVSHAGVEHERAEGRRAMRDNLIAPTGTSARRERCNSSFRSEFGSIPLPTTARRAQPPRCQRDPKRPYRKGCR